MTCTTKNLVDLGGLWQTALGDEFQKTYMQRLRAFVKQERACGVAVYPPSASVFNAFYQTPLEKVRVVIIGQDPYHGEGQAHGLSFSVPEGMPIPPSLQNMFKELKEDLGVPCSKSGCLLGWARQGVFLLNATLTVRAGEPKSHYGQGWEEFTDQVVRVLYARKEPLVFLLWGKSAEEKLQHIQMADASHHLILTAAHPSPFSSYRGFFGCRHFSKTNAFLKQSGYDPIDWDLTKNPAKIDEL